MKIINKYFFSSTFCPSLIKLQLCGLLILAVVAGCASIPLGATPQFVGVPEIKLNPYSRAPLAGVLSFSTDIPVRVSLHMSMEDKQWDIGFDEFNTEHHLPVLGFRADKLHEIRLQVHSRGGRQAVYSKPLIVKTDPLPDGFPSITVTSDPARMQPGYTLFNVMPHGDNLDFGALTVIVDEVGEVVWYTVAKHFRDVRKLSNGNLLTLQGNQLFVLDMLGGVQRKLVAIGKSVKRVNNEFVLTPSFHHEVIALPNDNLVVLSIEARPYDNYYTSEKDVSAPRKTVNVAGDVVVEIDPDGNIVKEWAMLDLLDPYRIGYGSLNPHWDKTLRMKTADWTHGNAVIHDERDDSFILSLRHQDATIKISRQTGELIWILGPHDKWDKQKFGKYLLHPVNNSTFFYPFHQHAPEIMPNGNLMIYDNGSYREIPFSENKRPPHQAFSRAVEYRIDEESMSVELVWEYGQFSDDKWYSGALGDADYLADKNTVLITHGSLHGEGGKKHAHVLEVTYDSPFEEVFNMDVFDSTDNPENGWRVYRAERISDLYPAGTIVNLK